MHKIAAACCLGILAGACVIHGEVEPAPFTTPRQPSAWEGPHLATNVAIAACDDRRRKGELETFTESVNCSNVVMIGRYQDAGYPHMDLIHLIARARFAEAGRLDAGRVTEAEMQLRLAEALINVAAIVRCRDDEIQRQRMPFGAAGDRRSVASASFARCDGSAHAVNAGSQ